MPSPQTDEQRAKGRFIALNAIRLGGVAMILFGIAIVQRVVDLPEIAGYVLIGFGMLEAFLVPTVLAKAWNTNTRNDGRDDLRGPPRP